MPEINIVLELETIISICAAVVSLIGMISTVYISHRHLKSTKVALELQHFNATNDLKDKVHDWAKESIFILSEVIILSELDPARATNYFEMRNKYRTNLYSLIDQGRWYFENDRSSGYGAWKRWSNQGLAPVVLDLLKKALRDNLERLNYKEVGNNQKHRFKLVEIKKDFTNEIQKYLQPEKTHKSLEEIQSHINQNKKN